MTTGRKLAVNVTAVDEDGRMVTFPAGATVSAKVAEGITNPEAWGNDPGESDETPKSIDDMTVAELKAEIDRRNEGRDDESKVAKTGNKDELAEALKVDDSKSTGAGAS